jgi:hypothetical protein
LTCSASGSSTTSQLTAGTGPNAQQILACEKSLPALAVPISGNCVPIIVDAGPCVYGTASGSSSASTYILGSANVPFTTVRICIPGTSTCQVIDHILVDTGSTGLRIMSSVLNAAMALPAVTVTANPLVECVQFADGYAWGSMRSADVRLAGEIARNIPVQVIGDSASFPVPSSCSSTTTVLSPLNDVASFGANGVLGVGVFATDCGNACVNSPSSFYYTCTTSLCSESVAALSQQATNPVSAFSPTTVDGNGLAVTLPAVATASSLVNPLGTLIFGVNTQSDNQTSTTVPHTYLTDNAGDFNSTLVSVTGGYTVSSTILYYNSFVDSGSNGIYLPGTNIPTDPTYSWFTPTNAASSSLPADVVLVSATQQGTDPNTLAPTGYKNSVQFDIANANTVLFNSATATAFDGLGASSSGDLTSSVGGVDWGLPFFFGKSVFVGIEGNVVTVGGSPVTGPYLAY